MSERTIIIVGAGVTGLSTAYHLALKKAGRIIVLDRGPVGDGSSSRAAAIITGQLWTEAGVLARKIALRRFRELSNELPGYTFNAVGCLNWFDRESWVSREALLPIYKKHDIPHEIIDSAEIRKRWPALTPPEDYIGLYDPLGGYSEPCEYVPNLANACRRLGVEILEYTAVQSILIDRNRARGVRTPQGDILGDTVVSTTYAWSNQVLGTVGINIPVKSFVHQRYYTRPLPSTVRIPAVNANPLYGYFRPAIGNRVLVGIETADRDEQPIETPDFTMRSLTTTPDTRQAALERFQSTLPVMKGATLESEQVGLINFSIDNEPVLGPVPGVEGLFVGAAFHSGGFAYNPVTGLLMAEMVNGEKTSIDVSTFSADRFDNAETRDYLATIVPQKHAARRRH